MDLTYAMGSVFGLLISGIIGALIGKNRKIGAGWAFTLGFFLSIVGWIIAVCSKKKDAPPKKLSKVGKILLQVFGYFFVTSGIIIMAMSSTYGSFITFLRSSLMFIITGAYMLHCTRKERPNAPESVVDETMQEETKVVGQISKEEDGTRFMPPAMRERLLAEQDKENAGATDFCNINVADNSETEVPIVTDEIVEGFSSGEGEQQADSVQDNESECDVEISYCKHCGKMIEADSLFCKYCGKITTI